ncbi:glutamyl-tRNA amidotransferase B subunit [Dictyostelium discoideum AX4]|uniref:Glutamyl-tRNA(Gln) amidotransferase subunit B, mitochondrial n=1 Tax=Dictyostelium discoideum TaxID=44689 RepID=GATB_DICDI|nr:glutamyl-tRNA amidotransferase B subunit [Dictyostelium discoideum AX4]Q55ER8.1 RecName: Full=Glutamyl-tRNA(Gln) amidotransferase subunit B, mitochondrial; Short=Glu-AdT subunit B [Dictyostelium discoideum]EAL72977.1 glutamyl-tRNA amidotransferase B subunit [Dictyostelium discoideum AX4]|eukprot:XP_646952.1 glutamyl-tRNA amidotransferase B subunit [Dictyostelium discoideum AX4]
MNYLNKINKINNKLFYSTTSSSNGIKNVVINNKDYLKSLKTNEIWELIVGIEVHAQTKTKEKLFSNSLNIGSMEGFKANSRVSFVDAAFPGALPVLNDKCVEQAIKTGLSIGGTINRYSFFDRKHYFYQDLPQGYQITQLTEPIVKGGSIELELSDGRQHQIRISHIQLEQDSGKSIHDLHPTKSLVDLNRAGIGLMEIVSHADFTSSEQVGCYIQKLQHLLKHIGSSDANMQFGEMRCDVNISVHKPNTEFGTRVELKNMISAKAIVSSIDSEAIRQIDLLENQNKIQRETRGFNQETGETYHLRTKEDEVDYRFFPDPDLPPLIISSERIETIKQQLGELPQDMKKRLIKQYSLTNYDAELLIQDQSIAKFFENSIIFNQNHNQKQRDIKKILNFLLRDIFSWLNSNNIQDFNSIINENQLSIEKFTQLLDLIEQGYISSNIGKTILFQILNGSDNRSPKDLIDSQGLSQISDDSLLDQLVQQLVENHPNEVTEYHQGKQRVYKFFMGEIMKKTKGRSNPEIVNNLLKKYLDLKKK